MAGRDRETDIGVLPLLHDAHQIVDEWTIGQCAAAEDQREVDVARDDPYRLEMENMSAAILGTGKLLLGRADALGQARTIDALYRSAASGQVVELAPL